MRSLNDLAETARRDIPLSRFTTFRIGGPARYLFEPRSRADLIDVLTALEAGGIPFRMLGGGSNILVSDMGFAGAVVRLAGEFQRICFEGLRVEAGSAAPLARLVEEAAARGLSGLEGLAGIPGTVGGALVMNAGGRWGSIGDAVESASVLSARGSGEPPSEESLTRGEARFGYRESILSERVILGATFALAQGERREVEARTRECMANKRRTQDLSARSAGCVFRNPPAGAAGALIERAGLKGARVGGAAVSAVHANFIVNTGSASAADVMGLIELVRRRVRESCGVDLETEIQLW